MEPDEPANSAASRHPWLIVPTGVALLVAALAPMLAYVEFGRTLENLNVATALEARRDGHWFIPTLERMPRTKKPPLTAWITALAMSPRTVAECSSRDAATRAAAFRRLALEARWPALLQSALAMIAVYHLGRIVGGKRIGATAAMIFGSSYLFFRYAPVSVTDVPLTLWVITANAFIAAALFERRAWAGCIGAGLAIGLAFLSKGPVAFIQTLAPLVAWLVWRAVTRSSIIDHPQSASPSRPRLVAAVAAGLLAFLAVGVPWYLAVLLKDPAGQWRTWFKEVTGSDAPERGEPWYTYGWHVLFFFPWILFWFGGVWLALRDAAGLAQRRADTSPHRDRFVYVLCLVLVPLLVMSFFKDKKDRYILPVWGPAAVLAARCVVVYLAERPQQAARDWVAWVHWGLLGAVGIGLPVLAATGKLKALTTVDGRPWYSAAYAAGAAAIALVLVAVGVRLNSTRRNGIVFASFLLMLVIAGVAMRGYRDTASGRSEMLPLANQIWNVYPDAELYPTLPKGRRASVDLSIYMNRPTGWITEEQMMRPPPGARPQVVLVQQQKHQQTPAAPPGWHLLAKVSKGDDDAWFAFARPAGAAK